MKTIKGLNLGVRLLLEVSILIIIGYWGFHSDTTTGKMGLGIGGPLLIALVWSLFGAPKAPYLLKGGARYMLELFLFALSVLSLFFLKHINLALNYLGIILLNRFLMMIWKQ